MNLNFGFYCTLLCLAVENSLCFNQALTSSYEKDLIKDLRERYQKVGTLGRPVKNVSESFNITVALHLIQILDLDENNQIFTTSMKSIYTWHDKFLKWDPEHYHHIDTIRLSSKDIWVPDIILANSVSEEEKIDNALVKITSAGLVTWTQRNVYQTSCSIDMQSYPFDKQTCNIILHSASYDKDELRLVSKYEEARNLLLVEGAGILSLYNEASEFRILEVRMIIDDVWFEESALQYSLVMERKSVFFTWIMLVPCLFLTMLTLVVFWLPPERPDKTTLAMSIFASFMVLLLVLVGSIPSTASSVPILGIYYFFNMVITALSISLATIVVNINRSDRSKPRVPKWMRVIVIETLGGMFGVTKTVSKVKEHQRLLRQKTLERQKLLEEACNIVVPEENGQEPPADLPDNIYDTILKRIEQKEKDEQELLEIAMGDDGEEKRSLGYDVFSLDNPAHVKETEFNMITGPFEKDLSPEKNVEQTSDEDSEERDVAKGPSPDSYGYDSGDYFSEDSDDMFETPAEATTPKLSTKLSTKLTKRQRSGGEKPKVQHSISGESPHTSQLISSPGTKHLKMLARLQRTMAETRDAVQTLCAHAQERDERDEAKDQKASEWRQVAIALDRTFFFLYMAAILIILILTAAILFPRAF